MFSIISIIFICILICLNSFSYSLSSLDNDFDISLDLENFNINSLSELELFNEAIDLTNINPYEQYETHSKFSQQDTVNPFTLGYCTTLTSNAQARLMNPCVGVVDYPYYLPPGKTPADLIKAASERLTSTLLLNLNSDCTKSIVSTVCASVFWRCAPQIANEFVNQVTLQQVDVTLGTFRIQTNNITKFSTQAYMNQYNQPIPLPFSRPCSTVCTNTLQTCATSPLFSFAVSLNCAENFDYTFGAVPLILSRYTNVTLYPTEICTTFTIAKVTASAPSEPYVPALTNTGVCKGFTRNLYSVPGTSLNPSFTTILPSYAAQTIIETQLATAVNSVPPWLTEECHKEFFSFLCNSFYMPPLQTNLGEILDNSNLTPIKMALTMSAPLVVSAPITVPRFLHYDQCVKFNNVCSGFIDAMKSKNTTLNFNCTSVDANGVRKFPEGRFNVASMVATLPSVGQKELHIPSTPNDEPEFHSSSYYYRSFCPYTFVKITDPNNANTQRVGFSECAIPCRAPVFSEDEWKVFFKAAEIIPILSIIFGVLIIASLIFNQIFLKIHILLLFILFSLLASSAASYAVYDDEEFGSFCYDKAIPATQLEDDQDESKVEICIAQGVILNFSLIAMTSSLILMALYLMGLPSLGEVIYRNVYSLNSAKIDLFAFENELNSTHEAVISQRSNNEISTNSTNNKPNLVSSASNRSNASNTNKDASNSKDSSFLKGINVYYLQYKYFLLLIDTVLVVIVPIILISIGLNEKVYGFSRLLPWCFPLPLDVDGVPFMSEKGFETWLVAIPMLILLIITCILFIYYIIAYAVSKDFRDRIFKKFYVPTLNINKNKKTLLVSTYSPNQGSSGNQESNSINSNTATTSNKFNSTNNFPTTTTGSNIIVTTSSSTVIGNNERTQAENQKNGINHSTSSYSAHALSVPEDLHTVFFCIFIVLIIIFFVFVILRLIAQQTRQDYLDSLTAWTQCMFLFYQTKGDSSDFITENLLGDDYNEETDLNLTLALETCGEYPEKRPLIPGTLIQLIILQGNLIFIALVYFFAIPIRNLLIKIKNKILNIPNQNQVTSMN